VLERVKCHDQSLMDPNPSENQFHLLKLKKKPTETDVRKAKNKPFACLYVKKNNKISGKNTYFFKDICQNFYFIGSELATPCEVMQSPLSSFCYRVQFNSVKT
jgi:hypothetical protein